ncbi:galectin-4-like [Anopheles maculipalpis]|uniref:galectin-4-like n=1 Tax=Anopheles maculipalpis TaxID=1496333 RepID=UPI002158B66D|nr:galectin-4-like [Anopheles maculipalpis]
MANLQIFTPILPYVGRLPGELRYGSRIKLRGHFREPQNTIHIILQKEALLNPQDDLPLYITVHPGRKEIVRNHLCSDCSTGQEERVDNCPIECGQDFELTVVPSSSGYEILLHGTPLHTFSYRTPLTTARYLFVSSGCVIFAISYENWNVTTSEQPHRPQTPSAPPLQLPQLYPILHQQREPQQQQHQQQQQRSIQAPQQPPQRPHHHHGNNLQELVLQVLPLVQLAASQLQANAHNAPATGSDGNGLRFANNLAHLLPLFQPAVEQRKRRVKTQRTNRWPILRMNNAEIMPAMVLTCSMGLMKLFRFLIIACVFGYIGYVFSRNTPLNVSWK